MSKIKHELEFVEVGATTAAGESYADTGNTIQDGDKAWRVSLESGDYYFEFLTGADVWIKQNL